MRCCALSDPPPVTTGKTLHFVRSAPKNCQSLATASRSSWLRASGSLGRNKLVVGESDHRLSRSVILMRSREDLAFSFLAALPRCIFTVTSERLSS